MELYGSVLDESRAYARELAQKKGMLYVSPFKHPDVVAGQGTLALELLDEPFLEKAEAIIIPIGGGGLISGCAAVLKKLKPNLKIYGVTAENAPSFFQSFQNKKVTPAIVKHTLAEGVSQKTPDAQMLEYILSQVDGVFALSEESIAHAITLLSEHGKLVVEGAGALPVAALLEGLIPEKRVVAVISGGNIDLSDHSRVLQRGLIEQGRLARLVIQTSDRPGALNAITKVLSALRVNIIQVMHTRGTPSIGVGNTAIEVDVETRARDHTLEAIEQLKANRFKVKRVF